MDESAPRPTPKCWRNKKERIRIVIRRRMRSIVSPKSTLGNSKSIERLAATKRGKSLNDGNIILINYKPIFSTSRPVKSKKATLVADRDLSERPMSFASPDDTEDPLMFIETMYQQLFTDDGRLRRDAEPTALANCVKQIVTNSRRSSTVRRDSMPANHYPLKVTSPCPSRASQPLPSTFSEEDEELDASLTHYRTFQRFSEQERCPASLQSIRSVEHKQNSNHTYCFSLDDTDNDDLDTFSDLYSSRKAIRLSQSASIDGEIANTDSKLLSSSGYQSLRSSYPLIVKSSVHHPPSYCPQCMHPLEQTSSISFFKRLQHRIGDVCLKYFNVILISKNVLLFPMIIFLLNQRLFPTGF